MRDELKDRLKTAMEICSGMDDVYLSRTDAQGSAGEAFRVELTKLLLFLTAADGHIDPQELRFIREATDYDFSERVAENIIAFAHLETADYVSKSPVFFDVAETVDQDIIAQETEDPSLYVSPVFFNVMLDVCLDFLEENYENQKNNIAALRCQLYFRMLYDHMHAAMPEIPRDSMVEEFLSENFGN